MMKKRRPAVIWILSLLLTACIRETSHDRNSIQFPAYTLENPRGQQVIDEINSTEKFTFTVELPEAWHIKEEKDREGDGALAPMGEFYTPLYLYEGAEFIGYVGFNRFEPYPNEDEIPQGSYYQTVYPALRLSSMFQWDPYTPVKTTETGETAVADIWYKNPVELNNNPDKSIAEISDLESLGILCCDKALKVYVGMAFCPGTVDQAQAEALAKSVELAPAQ